MATPLRRGLPHLENMMAKKKVSKKKAAKPLTREQERANARKGRK